MSAVVRRRRALRRRGARRLTSSALEALRWAHGPSPPTSSSRCAPSWRAPPATRSTRRARPRRWTRCGCSTRASCASTPTTPAPTIATASSSARATAPPRTTRCWPQRGLLPAGVARRLHGARQPPRLAPRPPARAGRRGLDGLARATGCRWPPASRWRCGRAALHEQRAVVLCGDAELNEGSNWEAVLLAPHLGLGNLTLLVIDNHSSSLPMGAVAGAPRRVRLGRPRRRRPRPRRAGGGAARAPRGAAGRRRRRHPAAVSGDGRAPMREAYAATTVSLFRDDPRVADRARRDQPRPVARRPSATTPRAPSTSASPSRPWSASPPASRSRASTPSRTRSRRSWPSARTSSSSSTSATRASAAPSSARAARTTTPARAARTTPAATSPRCSPSRACRCWRPATRPRSTRLLRATYANGRPTYVRTSVARNERGHDVAPGPAARSLRRGAGPTVRRLRAACSTARWRPWRASTRPSPTPRRSSRSTPRGLAALAGAQPDVVVVEPWYEGSSRRAPSPPRSATSPRATASSACRGASCTPTARAQELDADLGLDAAGIRRRLSVQAGRGSPSQ